MSLPPLIVEKIKTIPCDPGIVSTDPQLAYLLSFSKYPISSESAQLHPRDTYQSPLAQHQFADFDDAAYDHLLDETLKAYHSKSVSVVKGIRSSFKEFFTRVSAVTYEAALKHGANVSAKDENGSKVTLVTSGEELDYRVETLKGNIPSKWPEGMKSFEKELEALPWNAFCSESDILLEDFIHQIRVNFANLLKRAKGQTDEKQRFESVDLLIREALILLGVALRTLRQNFIMSQVRFIVESLQQNELSEAEERSMSDRLCHFLNVFVSTVPQEGDSQTQYHYLENYWDKNAFLLMKKAYFQKSAGLGCYSLTTDGKYLYLYVSAVNGAMYKFGTGNGGTVAGKVYHQKSVTLPVGVKPEEINWVYLKGSLYLKTFSREPSSIEILCPETFNRKGYAELACQSLFGHNVLNILNKNSILLTDGEKLYFLGKRIRIIESRKDKGNPDTSNLGEKKDSKDESKKQQKKKKKGNENQPQQPPANQGSEESNNSTKILEIMLAQFDCSGAASGESKEDIDESCIDELFESFSGYYSRQQCRRAFCLNHYDVMEACQWLFDEGSKEKEGKITILPSTSVVVLCESEITSNFNEKNFKNPTEIVTKPESLLHIGNVNESIWTMDTEEVTCYSESGVKIFDKFQKASAQNEQKRQSLKSNLIAQKKHIRIPRNPEYSILFDPYNRIFYTFAWPLEGHSLPCAVMASNDRKQMVESSIQKRSSIDSPKPRSIKQIGKYTLTELNLLNLGSSPFYHFNDPLWEYGRKIHETTKGEVNSQNGDDKKKLSNKRSKLMLKLNKVNQKQKRYQSDLKELQQNGKVIRQIIKIAPFGSDGSLQNLNLILSAFEGIENCHQNNTIAAFLLIIQKWLSNSSTLVTRNSSGIGSEIGGKQIESIRQILMKVRDGPSTSDTNKHEVNKIMIRHFDKFYSVQNVDEPIEFIASLNLKQLQSFARQISCIDSAQRSESVVYELTKKDQVIQKYDSKCDFVTLFKAQSSAKYQNLGNKNLMAHLLLRKDPQRNERNLKFSSYLENCICSDQSNSSAEFFLFLFQETLRFIINSTKKDSSQLQKLTSLQNLFEDTFFLMEKCLSNCSQQKASELTDCLLTVTQIYFASIVRVLGNKNIIKSLLSILELLQRPNLIEICNSLPNSSFEGISAINEEIFETSHPLERGKSQAYGLKHYSKEEVCCVYVDIDKRCQSDVNHDIFTLQTLHQNVPVGNSIPCRDTTNAFNTNIRLTGKVDSSKPMLLYGNDLTVDFTSSGHAKDAQSFGRFGFKVGIRPIVGGSVHFQEGAKSSQFGSEYGSLQQEKRSQINYVNCLKFLVVVASSSIEHLFTIERETCSESIRNLLTGKIMKQGLEESEKNVQEVNKVTQVAHFLESDSSQDEEKKILQILNTGFWEPSEKEADKKTAVQTDGKKETDIWDAEGVPQHIRGYIEQIKNFEGDFVEVFKEAREHAPPKGNYSNELRRPSFTKDLKQVWMQGEALLFLTVLKHSGLLHLNLKFSIEYIKENLKAFEEARDGIFYSFISRMQTVREWRDLIETINTKPGVQQEDVMQEEVKPQKKPTKTTKQSLVVQRNNRATKTVKITEKKSVATELNAKKSDNSKKSKEKQEELQRAKAQQIEKDIRERLSSEYLVKQLCTYRNIPFNANNLYETTTLIIEDLKQQKEPCSNDFVYVEPIEHLIKSCLFLLACRSPSTKQSLEGDNEIVPMALQRSLSSDSRNANKNKVEVFREWLENWKKWKGFNKDNKVELKFPVLEIVEFINSWTPVSEVKSAIHRRSLICERRVEFYQHLTTLVKLTSGKTYFGKYVFGSELLSSQEKNCLTNLESAPSSKINRLKQNYELFGNCIRETENKFLENVPFSFSSFTSELQKLGSDELLKRIKKTSTFLYMLESENPSMQLDVALYFINFKFLSSGSENEELLFISSLLVQRAFCIEYSVGELVSSLKRQVGDNCLSAKRWKDLLFMERVLFLLRKLEMSVRTKQGEIDIDDKRKIAETVFYLLNLTDIALVTRVGLRILKRLRKDLDFSTVNTVYDFRYKNVTIEGDRLTASIKGDFSVNNSEGENNIQLMAKKSLQIFKESSYNQVQKKLLELEEDQNLEKQENEKVNIVLNLHQEEDLIWLLRVFYYLEEMARQSGKGTVPEIKDWKHYLETKGKKVPNTNAQQVAQQAAQNAQNNAYINPSNNSNRQPPSKNNPNQSKEVFIERIVGNIPDKLKSIDMKLEEQLPVGWFMSYCNVFQDHSQQAVPHKKRKKTSQAAGNQPNNKVNKGNKAVPGQNGNKKPWASTLFLKNVKKFEEFTSKPLAEPQETDSEEVKAEFVRAKNFITRIKRHLNEIGILLQQFTQNGHYVLKEDIEKDKALQICHLIALGSEHRLKPIPVDFTNADFKSRLTVEDEVKTSSKIVVNLIENSNYEIFEELLSLESNSPVQSDKPISSYSKINRKECVLEDSIILPFEDFLRMEEAPEGNFNMEFAKELVDSSIFKMKKRHEEVYLPDYPKLKYFIAQGGIETGLKETTLVPGSDQSLTIQTAALDRITTMSPTPNKEPEEEEQSDFPEEIIQKVVALIKEKPPKARSLNSTHQLMHLFLASFYLKKLSKMDLSFTSKDALKELAEALVKFSEGFKSFQPIEFYQKETQKLLIKLIESEHKNLSIFEIFRSEDYEVSPSLLPFTLNTESSDDNVNFKDAAEDHNTHNYPKSEYLLKSQLPQIEENRLLKYWEKNILPKIMDFVKTTLRPLEIQDFFQQMRMPLRKNDQMQAKKIAYVICDNKLPQGATLPDSNHNWNSFSIEDIVVGLYALVKLPNNKIDCISPLLMVGNQQYRLAKVMHVDIKTSSILIRYRIEEYGIMSYAWVPINSLIGVEKQIMHLSPKDIYSEIEKNLKGMIYGYSKLCLTQLTSVSNLDETKLIKETIVDMFIKDPIAGWLKKAPSEWSMRPALKKMITNGNFAIIESLEKEFCPVKSYDTNLFSEKLTKLNRFENATALIVSFKNTAEISLSSGVKFYKDAYMLNEILHVYTTKSERKEFEPLVFNDPNVYSKYYTNKECLKVSDQNKYNPKPIEVTVFGIEQTWTIGCYLGSVISEIVEEQKTPAALTALTRLNKLYVDWILKGRVAVLNSYLCRLVTQIASRIISIQATHNIAHSYESLGVDEATVRKLVSWVRELYDQEEEKSFILYSQLLQNLSEMTAVLMWKNHKPKSTTNFDAVPEHIEAMIKLQDVIKLIDENLKGKKTTQKHQPNGQWQRLLKIDNVPSYMEEAKIKQKLKAIFENNKAKILCPKLDIFNKDGKILICVEGWNTTELVEEEIMEKIEKEDEMLQENEAIEQQDQGLMMEWECGACTMINPMGNTHCEICGTEMPPPPKAVEVFEKVEATDVSKAQNKLKQLEAKRFEAVKEEINTFFSTYWEEYCEKVKKQNAEIEENKLKEVKKKKSGGNKREQEKEEEAPSVVIQPPQKPSISLTVGTEVLGDPFIEMFLEERFKCLAESIQNLVKGKQTYLQKFKELENIGYDLWGDNIFHENPSLIPFERLYQLMNYIQGEICKGSSSVLSYSENSIRLLSSIPLLDQNDCEQPINYQTENNIGVKTKYKNLAELKSYNVRYSWKMVKELNVAASKCLQFVNMSLRHYELEEHRGGVRSITDSDCLGFKLKYFRNLIMGAIKLELSQKIIQKTSVLREPEEIPKVNLERLRIKEERNTRTKMITSKEKDDYLFTKAHEQFSKISPAMLRPFKPKGTDPYLSFSVTFRGENAMGEAGPYRQFFTDVSNELDPKNHLGLFIATPNNVYKTGEGRSKWTLNPKANSSYHLSLLEFVGTLMGCCIRTGTHLALDLPKLFWKLLVGEPVSDRDLEEVDMQMIETLNLIKGIESEEQFEQIAEYSEPITWVYTTSDGEQHELKHNGKQEKVAFEEKEKYIREFKKYRINESSLQISRIKKGLYELIPEPYFNCLTGDEIKLLICGRPFVDVDLLKKHTKYAGALTEDSSCIKYFWEVMRELEETDKLKVIKFCWGQERLPINSEEFDRNSIRFMIKPMMNREKMDLALPKADTCFFNIELPNYSSKAILKEKLLLAVNLDCVSINADENFSPDDNPLMNEIEEDAYEDNEEGNEDW